MSAFAGWKCHWRDRVLVGLGPGGVSASVGEVWPVEDGPGCTWVWELLRPDTGARVATGTALSLVGARSAAADRAQREGSAFGEPVDPDHPGPGVTPDGRDPSEPHARGPVAEVAAPRRQASPARDRVVACVLRHPEGISSSAVGAEVGCSSGAASHALQKAVVHGLVRHTGSRATAKYWPPNGYVSPPDVAPPSPPEVLEVAEGREAAALVVFERAVSESARSARLEQEVMSARTDRDLLLSDLQMVSKSLDRLGVPSGELGWRLGWFEGFESARGAR